jgi:hypothetical protein
MEKPFQYQVVIDAENSQKVCLGYEKRAKGKDAERRNSWDSSNVNGFKTHAFLKLKEKN